MNREEVRAHLRANVIRNVVRENEREIRVMSSNVLFGGWKDGIPEGLTYQERAMILTEYYFHFKPDFLGLQEMEPSIHAEIVKNLEEEYAIPPTEYEGKCIFTPTLYRKDSWEPLKTGHHRFRLHWCWQYHWCLYQSRKDPEVRVIHMNFHYPPGSMPYVESRCEAVVELNAELRRLLEEYPNTPLFLSGDYNVTVGMAEYYGTFARGVKMQSGMLLTEDNDGYGCACHQVGVTPGMGGKAIDHVSVTEDTVTVKRHRIICDEVVIFGSDHCPIFIDAELKRETQV